MNKEIEFDTKAAFEAGKGWDYSDTNYIVLADRGRDPVMIGDVADDERPPLHEVAVTGGEIVIDDRNKAGLGNGLGAMGSDISRAARDEDRTPARH